MFVGWQLYDDLDALVQLSQGKPIQLEIDILTGQCLADGQRLSPLGISEAMQSWFAERLERHNIPAAEIGVARLTVEYRAKVTKRKDVSDIETEFLCHGLICTSDHEYVSINGRRGNKPSLSAA